MTPALVIPVLGRKLYPGASVALDFTRNLYRNTAVVKSAPSLLSGWTFARASVKNAENTVGLVVPFASGSPAITDKGLLIEEARTNVVLWSRDQTNAAWTKTNMTAAKDQTGADGVANSASSLTATAANATSLQAIVLGSSARWQSAYIKRVTGSGTVNMTMDNGTTWTAVTVTSAWAKVEVPTQTLANPTVGFRIVTSGDAIAVDFVQNEGGTFATSPIETTTAQATRQTDVASISGLAYVNPLTMFVQFNRIAATGVLCGFAQLDVGASTDRQVLRAGTTNLLNAVAVTASSVVADTTVAGAMAAATTYRGAGRFALNSVQAARTGTLGTEDTSAAMPASLSVLRVGSETNGGNPANAYIERIVVYPSAFTDAALQALTT